MSVIDPNWRKLCSSNFLIVVTTTIRVACSTASCLIFASDSFGADSEPSGSMPLTPMNATSNDEFHI